MSRNLVPEPGTRPGSWAGGSSRHVPQPGAGTRLGTWFRTPGKLRAVADRWATFDCYGTLVDWNGGIRSQLERLFGADRADDLLERYHELEPAIEADRPSLPYRDVMARVLEELGAPPHELGALGSSLPEWPVFPEAPAALEEARARGWRLCILSNTDRDFIEASMAAIGVPFDRSIVAAEVGSYKPAHGHWHAFERETGRLPDVHVAASLFHDIAVANELELPSIWINRLGEQARPEAAPTRELPDLSRLADTLDELVSP
jgi:2-haloacid dehalogenase